MSGSEIVETPGREQPFAVWVRGKVILFTDNRVAAETALAEDLFRYRNAAAGKAKRAAVARTP